MTLTERIYSYWRCDFCGESYTVWIDLGYEDDEPPRSLSDMVTLTNAECAICGGQCRRIVSPTDFRSLEDVVGIEDDAA